jgi:uncharacterized membrane protein
MNDIEKIIVTTIGVILIVLSGFLFVYSSVATIVTLAFALAMFMIAYNLDKPLRKKLGIKRKRILKMFLFRRIKK